MRELPLADRPTAAPPGSPEKVLVMAARARAGRAVFHPGDAAFADAQADGRAP
jgi:hypothetical protein